MKKSILLVLNYLILICFIACNNEKDVQEPVIPPTIPSNNQYRLTWNVEGVPPGSFLIERSVNKGEWIIIEESYSMPTPYRGYKFNGINQNYYYIDKGLKSGNTYDYKVNGRFITSVPLKGTTYYVKNGGNDNADGLSDSSAWATIERANSHRRPGDLVLFKRGDIFRSEGKIILFRSGNGSENNPIRWSAYGKSDKPILEFNHEWGLNIQDVNYWSFEFLHFKGTPKAKEFIIIIRAILRDVSNIKILNCDLDASSITEGFSKGLMLYEADASIDKTSTKFIDNIEVAYSTFTGMQANGNSVVGPWSCRSNFHFHNNFVYDNISGVSIAGGLDHIFEFNEIRGNDYGTGNMNEPEGTKAHGQQHPLENMTYRHNLIYNCQGYGISLQDSKNGLVEYNTVYNGDYGYGAFLMQAINQPEDVMGNVIKNNIFYGSRRSEGALRNVISRDNYDGLFEYNMGLDWREKVIWDYNCIYPGKEGDIVLLYDIINGNSSITSHEEWLENWLPYHPNDIHADPQFVNPKKNNFRLKSNSPAKGMGYAGALE